MAEKRALAIAGLGGRDHPPSSFYPVGVAHQSAEEGVGDGRIAYRLVPVLDNSFHAMTPAPFSSFACEMTNNPVTFQAGNTDQLLPGHPSAILSVAPGYL